MTDSERDALREKVRALAAKWREKAAQYRKWEQGHPEDPRAANHEWAVGYIHLEMCADELLRALGDGR